MRLRWEDAQHNDEPRDQNADTALVPHGYWDLGPEDEAGTRWSVTLVVQDEGLAVIREESWQADSEEQIKAVADRLERGEEPWK